MISKTSIFHCTTSQWGLWTKQDSTEHGWTHPAMSRSEHLANLLNTAHSRGSSELSGCPVCFFHLFLFWITVTWVNLYRDWCSCGINDNKSLLLSDATRKLCLVQVPLAEIFVWISYKYQALPVEYTVTCQIIHNTQSFQWHIHHLRLTGRNFAVCTARNNALLVPVMGKLSQNPSAIDFYQGQGSGFKELTIPYKTSLKYELCWEFHLKRTQRISHTTPAHRYILPPVRFSPYLLKPKQNYHSMSLSLSVLQPWGLFFSPLRKVSPMGECWETQTEWETVGTGILNAWVPGRSVPVIHSVALCWALSHELVLENKKKNLIFFTWPVSLWGLEEPAHLHEGLLHTQARSDTPGLTPQQWWWLFAWIPRTPTCCKITFFIFNPLQYRITLVSVLLPVPWAYFLQLLCSFSSPGRWWQLFLRPVCSGYSTSSPN